jgi:MATE family multidrug resistance protein
LTITTTPELSRPDFLSSARRIGLLAWPVFVGQLAVLAFSTVDTVMAARAGALDLAALAIGSAAYVTIFVGLMGVVLAIGPIAGQLYGAGRLAESGRQFQQSLWLALGLSALGASLLFFPEPFLRLANAPPEVEAKVRAYLAALVFALPPALIFTAFRGFCTSVSRPKAVMALQLAGLTLKVPLTALLVFGARWGDWQVPALGAPGCGIATAIAMTGQALVAVWLVRRDRFYAPFGLHGRFARPDRASLAALLRLGIPMGASIAIEVTGFTFMALFISRIGATPVAGHQIAVNMVSMMFMIPLAIANAAAALVAQRIGADDPRDARRLGWHGLQAGIAIAALVGGAVFMLRDGIVRIYTHDESVVAAALPLLAWVAVFHVADAAQTVSGYVLRAYRVATVPVVIYAVALWGVGLGGGYTIAFNTTGWSPPALQGAQGFWLAATAGLIVAGTGMSAFLGWMLKHRAVH